MWVTTSNKKDVRANWLSCAFNLQFHWPLILLSPDLLPLTLLSLTPDLRPLTQLLNLKA